MTAEPERSTPGDDSGRLLSNLVLFARLLRVGDLDVTPVQMSDWLEAISRVGLSDKQDFKNASRAVLVRRREDLEWFDLAFELFWQARDQGELDEIELGIQLRRTNERRRRLALGGEEANDLEERLEPELIARWSDREALRHKDFAELSGSELREIRRAVSELRFDLDRRQSRRRIPGRRGSEIDLRNSLRRALRSDGELLELMRKERKRKPRPLVVLCDISGSMEPYSRLLLHFVYAVGRATGERAKFAGLEGFVFGTRLTRITRNLRRRNVDDALRMAYAQIDDWGGGTRTGEALATFNRVWSRRVLAGGAVVLLISDGWDRGDADQLGREIAHLHRSCDRLVWLNPLLGDAGYEPLTRGMQAALPHLDDFLPVHNLHSLEQLGRLLADLPERR